MSCAAPRVGVGQGTFLKPLGRGSLGVLGSGALFSGTWQVGRRAKSSAEYVKSLPRPLFNAGEWRCISTALCLSPMQTKVVALVIAGKTDRQIAIDLGVGISTVRAHLDKIFIRLGISGRAELIACVFATFRREC